MTPANNPLLAADGRWRAGADMRRRIITRRREWGFGPAQVAQAAGISRATLWRLEHGAGSTGVDVLERVATILGLVLVAVPVEAADGPLGFDTLRTANVERCETAYHPLRDWSPTDWACAAAGELGEACNLIKKLRRPQPVPIEDVAAELADAVIYIDLLCARLGIDLGAAITTTFNGVSERVGSPVRLPENNAGSILPQSVPYGTTE